MKHKRLCEPEFGKKGNYTLILPIDQGVEHGPHAAFYASDHPEMLDINYQVDYIAELLEEGLVGATALPQRTANLLKFWYPHLAKDIIMKLNHGNNLNKDLAPTQAVYATTTAAQQMGGVGFTPIINPPEVAILGVSRAKKVPVLEADKLVEKTILPVALSYDHRVINGADAGKFMNFLKSEIEKGI